MLSGNSILQLEQLKQVTTPFVQISYSGVTTYSPAIPAFNQTTDQFFMNPVIHVGDSYVYVWSNWGMSLSNSHYGFFAIGVSSLFSGQTVNALGFSYTDGGTIGNIYKRGMAIYPGESTIFLYRAGASISQNYAIYQRQATYDGRSVTGESLVITGTVLGTTNVTPVSHLNRVGDRLYLTYYHETTYGGNSNAMSLYYSNIVGGSHSGPSPIVGSTIRATIEDLYTVIGTTNNNDLQAIHVGQSLVVSNPQIYTIISRDRKISKQMEALQFRDITTSGQYYPQIPYPMTTYYNENNMPKVSFSEVEYTNLDYLDTILTDNIVDITYNNGMFRKQSYDGGTFQQLYDYKKHRFTVIGNSFTVSLSLKNDQNYTILGYSSTISGIRFVGTSDLNIVRYANSNNNAFNFTISNSDAT